MIKRSREQWEVPFSEHTAMVHAVMVSVQAVLSAAVIVCAVF